jgi:hypothetical protein
LKQIAATQVLPPQKIWGKNWEKAVSKKIWENYGKQSFIHRQQGTLKARNGTNGRKPLSFMPLSLKMPPTGAEKYRDG